MGLETCSLTCPKRVAPPELVEPDLLSPVLGGLCIQPQAGHVRNHRLHRT